MIHFEMRQLFPRFLLEDQNGYAMAKAVTRGIELFLKAVQDGIDTVLNEEKMPEWRLDEMAWETGCMYDYTAEVEAKRKWIRNATPWYSMYGTPAGICQFLEGYFDDIDLEEWWQYGGDPYHFRVVVSGEWTRENELWARRVIEEAKNVRSVLDDLSIVETTKILVGGKTDFWRFPMPMTGASKLCGTLPGELF